MLSSTPSQTTPFMIAVGVIRIASVIRGAKRLVFKMNTKLSQTVRNLLPHPSKEQIDILYQIAYTFSEHLEEITKAIILPSKADAFLQVASAFLFYHGQSKFRSLKQSVRKHRLDGAIS